MEKCKVERAKLFASTAHRGQFRKYNGEPFVNHPKRVCEILKMVTKDEDILSAALLHDVVEDCDVSLDQIQREFGVKVAAYVFEVTKSGEEGNKFNVKSRGGLLIKLADTIDNVSTGREPYVQKKIKLMCSKMNGETNE